MNDELELPEIIKSDLAGGELPSTNFVFAVAEKVQKEIQCKKNRYRKKKRVSISLGIFFLSSILLLIVTYYLPSSEGFNSIDHYISIPYIGLATLLLILLADKVFFRKPTRETMPGS